MTTSIRSLLNRELGILRMPPEWWSSEVCALLMLNDSLLMVALRHALEARDCPQIGLGAEQCIGTTRSEHPVTATLFAAARRGVATHGCNVYAASRMGPEQVRHCVRAGIKQVYYSYKIAHADEIESLRKFGIEIVRVDI